MCLSGSDRNERVNTVEHMYGIICIADEKIIKIILLKVHKIENFFDSDFGICVISLIVMSKY